MKTYFRITAFLLSTVLILSCNPSQQEVEEDITGIIRSNWDSFIEAWHRQDAEACAAFYAIDGQNIPSGSPISNGRKEIEEFYMALFDNHISSNYRHDIKYITHSASLAVELAEFHVEWIRKDSVEWVFNSRSLTHWEKDESGEWNIRTFLFNMAP